MCVCDVIASSMRHVCNHFCLFTPMVCAQASRPITWECASFKWSASAATYRSCFIFYFACTGRFEIHSSMPNLNTLNPSQIVWILSTECASRAKMHITRCKMYSCIHKQCQIKCCLSYHFKALHLSMSWVLIDCIKVLIAVQHVSVMAFKHQVMMPLIQHLKSWLWSTTANNIIYTYFECWSTVHVFKGLWGSEQIIWMLFKPIWCKILIVFNSQRLCGWLKQQCGYVLSFHMPAKNKGTKWLWMLQTTHKVCLQWKQSIMGSSAAWNWRMLTGFVTTTFCWPLSPWFLLMT